MSRRTSIPFTRALFLFLCIALAECGKPAAVQTDSAPGTKSGNAENRTTMTIAERELDSGRRAKSVTLNNDGLAAYKAGKIEEAVSLFRESIAENSMHVFPHYNLACMLSLLIKAQKQADEDELYDELAIALALDAIAPDGGKEWVRDAMKTDADLAFLRDTARFTALLGSAKPEKLSQESLVTGTWEQGSSISFSVKLDRTFAYAYKPDGEAEVRSEGTWAKNGDSAYVFTGPAFGYPAYDAESDSIRIMYSDTLVFDPCTMLIDMFSGNSDYTTHPVARLEKTVSPLAKSVDEMNVQSITALLAQDICPGYACTECASGKPPLETVIASGRIALIRLFIGKDGIWPYPYMYVSAKQPESALIEEFMNRSSKTLLARLGKRAKYDEAWYRELVDNPLSFADGLTGGYGSSNAIYPVGFNNEYIAYVESRFYSSMPGSGYSVAVMNVLSNSVASRTNIGTVIGGGVDMFPYSAMKEEDVLVGMFFNAEREWTSEIAKYGIQVTRRFPRVEHFPCRIGGSRYDCRAVELKGEREEAEDYPGYGSAFDIELSGPGGSMTIGSFQAVACMVHGYLPLGGANAGTMVVIVSTLQKGFENEDDIYLRLIGTNPLGK